MLSFAKGWGRPQGGDDEGQLAIAEPRCRGRADIASGLKLRADRLFGMIRRPRPTVFLDRDGIVNVDTGYPHRPDELVLTPTVALAIARLNRAGCLVIVVTNQSGVARGLFDLAAVDNFHTAIQQRLAASGARIDAFYVAPWHPDGTVPEFAIDHPDRKPGPGMILRAMEQWPVDRTRTILFGDKASDIEAASRAGIPAERLTGNICDLDAAVAGWLDRLASSA